MDEQTKKRLDQHERRIGHLTQQLELERVKQLSLMSILVEAFNLKVVESGSKFASIAPIERRDGDSKCAVLAFAGLAQSLSMPIAEFNQMSARHDQLIYFLKDHHQAWYQQGLLGLSTDVETTVEVLKSLLAPAAEDLRMFGVSAGGFAAIMFGVLLNARKVVAIAPQTLINAETVDKFRSRDTRKARVLEGQYLDLLALCKQNKSTEIHVHYAAHHADDSLAALRLEGLPGVCLHAHDYDAHTVAAWLKSTGGLDAVLAPIFG